MSVIQSYQTLNCNTGIRASLRILNYLNLCVFLCIIMQFTLIIHQNLETTKLRHKFRESQGYKDAVSIGCALGNKSRRLVCFISKIVMLARLIIYLGCKSDIHKI